MKDYIIRAMDKERSIRVFMASTTNMVEEARKIHNTTPTITAGFGRVLTASSIMGVMLKGDKDKVTLQFRGEGRLKTILAVSNNKGEVKGYVSNPNVEVPLKSNGKLDVGGALGNRGKLIVIRDLGLKEPYIGQSNLVNGEIAEDLTRYFAASEQQPSAVALGVLVDKDLSVKASGGFIVQVLPNISEELLTKLEDRLNSIEPISKLIDKGKSPEEILNEIFEDFGMEIMDKQEVKLSCDCSRERMEEALISLGQKELKNIIEEDGEAELVCHFCNTKYKFNEEKVEGLIKEIQES